MSYMEEAIKEALIGIKEQHGGPFGAVIVKNGKIIGKGHNRVLVNHDPTCHGEISAIRDACHNLGTHDLSGCSIYTTAAPCPMCKGAILWANISEVFYGCTTDDTDDIGFRDSVFYENWSKDDSFDYGEEIERDKCLELFDAYKNMNHEIY